MPIEIQSLEGLTFNKRYEAFDKAFADYEVKMTKTELERMLRRRGFFPQLSFGAFENVQLVAFTFNGIGTFKKRRTAYDTGTGTIPEYRGQGLARCIFQHSIPYLQQAGVKQYLLEVLQNNKKAVALYQKMGFEVTREFNYYIIEKNRFNFASQQLSNEYTLSQVDIRSTRFDPDFEDHLPSWQNRFDSVNRSISDFLAYAVYYQGTQVAYCIFDPDTGDITKLAVHPKHRSGKLENNLLKKVVANIQNDKVKFINIPPDTSTFSFLHSLNISPTGQQFEMIKEI